jgi:hypothetical protein
MAARLMGHIKLMPGRKRRLRFSAFPYRYRSLVESLFSKLKNFRAIALKSTANARNLVLVKLASAKIWMRFTSR